MNNGNERVVVSTEVAAAASDSREMVESKGAIAEAPVTYIGAILETLQHDLLALNPGMDLDFVHLTEPLRMTKNGVFQTKDGSASFGHGMDVVIGKGESRYVVWGRENTPYDGELMVAEKERVDAIVALDRYISENPDAAAHIDYGDISLNYAACMINVEEFQGSDSVPEVYIQFFPKTDALEFGKYCKRLMTKGFPNVGIPKRTGVGNVITRITSTERSRGDISWTGRMFEPVAMFRPEEFNTD